MVFLLHVRLPPACAIVATNACLHWGTLLPLNSITPLFEVPDVQSAPWAAVMRNLCAAVTLEEELIPNGVGRVGYARLLLQDTAAVCVTIYFGPALPGAKLLMPAVFEQLQCWPNAVASTTPLTPFFGDDVAPCVRVRQLWHTVPCEPRHVHAMLMNVAAADAAQRAAPPGVRGPAHRARPMRLGASPAACAAVAAVTAVDVDAPDAATMDTPHAATQAALAAWMLTIEQHHPVTQCLAAPLVTQSADVTGGRDADGVPLHGGVVVAMPGGGRRALVQLLCRTDAAASAAAPAPVPASVPPPLPPHLAELQLCHASTGASVDFAQLHSTAPPRRAGGTLLLAATAAEATRWFAALKRAGGAVTALLYTGRTRAAHAAQLHTFDAVVTTYATLQREDAAEEQDAQRWCAGVTMRCPDVEYVCSESESAAAPADARDAIEIQSRWFAVTRPATAAGRVWGRWLPPGRAAGSLPAPEVLLALDARTPRRKVGVCSARHRFALPGSCDTCRQTYPESWLAAVRARLPRSSPLAQVCWRRVVCDDADVLNKRGVGRSVHAMITAARRWCLLRPGGAEGCSSAQWLPPDVLRPLHGPLAFVASRAVTPSPREDAVLAWHMEPLVAVLPTRPLPAPVPPQVLRVTLTCADAAKYDARRRACSDVVRMRGCVMDDVVRRLASVCIVAPPPAPVTLRFPEDCCPVCHERVARSAVVALPCGHGFCAACLLRMLVQHRVTRCEYCRSELAAEDIDTAVSSCYETGAVDASAAVPSHRGSHKIAAVVQLLRSDPDSRTLLVTESKRSIAILARELRDADIPVATVTSAKAPVVAGAGAGAGTGTGVTPCVTIISTSLAAMLSAVDLRGFARVVVLDAAVQKYCASSPDVVKFRRVVASVAVPTVHIVTLHTVEELLYDAAEGAELSRELLRHLEA